MKIYTIEDKKRIVDNWFNYLQNQISSQFFDLETNLSKSSKKIFVNEWKKDNPKHGGGKSIIIKNGKVFEKVGINKSTVSGIFEKKFRKNILGADKNGKYWASGVSVVAHMKNPHIPALHFNTRFIVTSKEWFGGGIDATPCIQDKREAVFFHKKLKQLCIKNKKNYKKYKNWCDEYFFLGHRNEPRGIGGIFFDYEKKNWINNFRFIRDVGLTFIELARELILKKNNRSWTKYEKEKQLLKRGRYVEFNLLYDRGTKFGLNSGGNTKSILMSLPPEAKWD